MNGALNKKEQRGKRSGQSSFHPVSVSGEKVSKRKKIDASSSFQGVDVEGIETFGSRKVYEGRAKWGGKKGHIPEAALRGR